LFRSLRIPLNGSGWTLSTFSEIRRRAAWPLVCAAAVLCALSCTSERPSAPGRTVPAQAESPAPASPSAGGDGYALKLEPREATRRTILVLSAEGFALRDVRVVWQVNGSPTSSLDADRFDCAGTRRGETVRTVAVVNGREVRSNDVTIGNTPPELTNVTLLPVKFGQEDSLAVSATATDLDDDKVVIQYSWTVNDVLAGNGAELGRALKRNDAVRVEVVAYDGQAYGNKIKLNQTIANHPPVFNEHQDFVFSGSTCAYRAQALDADGDQITYSLASPAAGMSIDPASGNVVWKIPDGFRGEQPFTIVADDGHLGTARYTVTFTIRD